MIQTWIATTALAVTLTAALCVEADEDQRIKLDDCPPAVKKTLELEAKGAKIENVNKVTEDDETTYWTSVAIGGKRYHLGVDDEGTLKEMGLEIAEPELAFKNCPAAVQATLHRESNNARFDVVAKNLKYGTTIYEAEVSIEGKEYSLVVSEKGTLIEKMLIIAEDEVELSHCPTPVQHALHELSRGGKVVSITRSTGIAGHVYEADLEINKKTYLVEITEGGGLIAKSLVEEGDN